MHKDLVFPERYVYIVVTKSHGEGHTSLVLQLEYVQIKGETSHVPLLNWVTQSLILRKQRNTIFSTFHI